LGWSQTTVHVDPHQGQWPASLLVGLGTPWNTLQIQSTLQLETQAIDVQWRDARLTVSGQAQLTAHQASSKLSTLSPMGSYRMQWRALGANAAQTHDFGQVELLTLQGPLELTGQGQWVAGRFRFNGQASAAAGSEEALSNLLNIVGRRDGTRSIIKIG
jgi:general secretion pathway protein N